MMRFLYRLVFLFIPQHPSGPRMDSTDASLLLRERYAPGAVDRTANQRQRFDQRGCWSQSVNTWLWVADPVLRRSDEPSLYFNSQWSERWFCLSAVQRRSLAQAVQRSEWSSRTWHGGSPVERWSAEVGGRRVWAEAPAGEIPAGLEPVARVLEELGRAPIWAQAPQPSALR